MVKKDPKKGFVNQCVPSKLRKKRTLGEGTPWTKEKEWGATWYFAEKTLGREKGEKRGSDTLTPGGSPKCPIRRGGT